MPAYASPFSRKDFAQHQPLAIPVLQAFLKADCRGVVALLGERTALRRAIGLTKVPDHSARWHAQQELSKNGASICPGPRAPLGLGVPG